ncbi:hypothetical protein TWF694_009591 [Orbilia ellipsospora]|uniref:Uncharacterized protein n=1 Tax=Orbilia ellipsospora TaxID=2528407 RepID=A0AAV9XCM1_9PEZI
MMSEARVFLGPGGRVARPGLHDGKTTVCIYFPFVVSDAIAIFSNIVAPGLDPFSVSAQSRREVFWPLIKRMTNNPKVVEPVAANGSPDIGDQVEALMQELDSTFEGGMKNVYINCAGTLVGVSASQIHQFLELSEKVFHLWKNRNDGSRSNHHTPASPTLPRSPTNIRKDHILNRPEAYAAAELEARSVHHRPTPLELPPAPPHHYHPQGPGSAHTTSSGADRRGSLGFISPPLPSIDVPMSARLDEELNRPPPPQMPNQPPPPPPPTTTIHDAIRSRDRAAITVPGAIEEANPLPLSEIWRATIYRLYSEQNESLTKYRRPNWLFHLESHGVRDVGDLGGWRGDDESTRQLGTNLITKLQETGYGTKGLQSRLKAITTVDIMEALENMRHGRMEKYRPGPILGKRVTPIKWPAYNMNGTNDELPVEMQLRAEAGEARSGSGSPENSLKRQVENSNGSDARHHSAHPIRIKRKRTSSPMRERESLTRESLTLVIPPENGDVAPTTQSAPQSATPNRPPPLPTPMGGFTPINANRSASNASMMPPPSTYERSGSTSTPSATPLATPSATPAVTPAPLAPTPTPPPHLPPPRPSPRMQLQHPLPPLQPSQTTPSKPRNSVPSQPEGEGDYEDDDSDGHLESRFQYLGENLAQLRREINEVRSSGVGATQQMVERTAKELFHGFTKDFNEDYYRTRSIAFENTTRVEKLEGDYAHGDVDARSNIQGLQNKVAGIEEDMKKWNEKLEIVGKSVSGSEAVVNEIDAQVMQHMKVLERQAASIGADMGVKLNHIAEKSKSPGADTQSTESTQSRLRVDKIEHEVDGVKTDLTEFKTEMGEVKNTIDQINSTIQERMDKLENKFDALDGDIKARNQLVDVPVVQTPTSPNTSRRATRSSSIHLANSSETVRMNRLELRMEKVESDVRERMDKMDTKMEAIENDVKEVMNAVSELMIRVMSAGMPQPQKQNGVRLGRAAKAGK